jgi:FimV-like protein
MKHPLPTHRLPRRQLSDPASDDTGTPRLQRSSLALALMMLATPGPLLAQAGTPTSSSSGATYTTVSNDTVWRLAGLALSHGGGNRAAVMVAILRRNPGAFVQGNLHRLKRGAQIVLPSAEDIAAEDPLLAGMLVESHLRVLDQQGAGAPGLPPLRKQFTSPEPAAASPANKAAAPAASSVAKPPADAVPAKPPVPAVAPPVAAAPVAPAPVKSAAPASAAAPVPAAAPAPVKATTPIPAPAPAPAPAAAAASAPASAARPAETVVTAPAASSVERSAVPAPPAPRPRLDAPTDERPLRVLPYAMLVVLLALPVGWWGYRRFGRKGMRDRLAAASSDFRDSKGNSRSLRPRRVEVSNAAVEVARVVETLRPVATLVKPSEALALPAGVALSTVELREQIALKLEIARASIEIGRALLARSLLAIVQQDGDDEERAAASALLLTLA